MNKRIKKKKEKQKAIRNKQLNNMFMNASQEFYSAFPISEAEVELYKKINSRSPRKLMTLSQNLSDFNQTDTEIDKMKYQLEYVTTGSGRTSRHIKPIKGK